MAWRIEVSNAAQNDLGGFDRQIAVRILRFLNERVAPLDDPRSVGEPLRGPILRRYWKYRVGDYRIVADIQDGLLQILVVRIGNRRDVYR